MSVSSEPGALGASPGPPATATAVKTTPTVLLVGNPNVGKTSLFNRLAQRNERVGNYPGVTVERRAADVRLASGLTISLVDVPGAYSLAARSAEEQVAFQAMIGWGDNPEPDLVVVVLDAGQLTRNLYLALQLIELQVPLVMALNMIDEAGDRAPEPEKLAQIFGVPCVATNARVGQGSAALLEAVERTLSAPPRPRLTLHYPPALIRDVDRVVSALPDAWRKNVERDRALALWALSSIEPTDELVGVPEALRARTEQVLAEVAERDIDREIIESRYVHIEAQLARAQAASAPRTQKPTENLTERIDRVLLHPAYGFAIFVLLMVTVFQSLFSWADPIMGLIEDLFGGIHTVALDQLSPGFFRDLLTQGLINGVGNVVVFLPQIMLLFLFIGLLEDSGYMARVAYLMDRVLRSVGLHGRAFVPMLSGFACAIPAVMATRTMERRRDRLLTMLVVPLMSCSARLPVYTLIIAALFPPSTVFGWLPLQGILLVAMYLFSITISLIAAAVLGRTVVRGRSVPLILELPRYRLPGLGSVLRMVWLRAKSFLTEAGTIILALTVFMWVLLSYPKYEPAERLHSQAVAAHEAANASSPQQSPRVDPGGAVLPPSDTSTGADEASPAQAELEAEAGALQIEHSFGGRLGKLIEPALAPLGFDWKLGIGIIGAFAAREVFVSVLGIVYGVGEVDDEAAPLRDRMRAETRPDGQPRYTPLVGLSLMVFFALACQCMSTVAVVKRETQSWRWPAFMFAYMTGLAWVASFIVFQLGRVLGF
ncbi:MAG: ferrous iron transport protein B [Polyangiaceae bacterium]